MSLAIENFTSIEISIVIFFFRSNFPDHEFIGEEDISDGSGLVSSFSEKPTWIIDPIDGTMNFVHR